jgi:hypothetical protein
MLRRADALMAVSAVLAVGGAAGGNRWGPLLGAALAWGLIALVCRSPAPHVARAAAVAGGVAALVIALLDGTLSSAWLAVPLEREFAALPISVGVEGVRGVLVAGSLYLYLRLRGQWSATASAALAALAGFCAGYAFEWAGARWRLWQWNLLWMPAGRLGPVWTFLPVAWSATFLSAGYYFAPVRRVAGALRPLVAGLRCGAAFCAFLLLSWVSFYRLLGRAGSL